MGARRARGSPASDATPDCTSSVPRSDPYSLAYRRRSRRSLPVRIPPQERPPHDAEHVPPPKQPRGPGTPNRECRGVRVRARKDQQVGSGGAPGHHAGRDRVAPSRDALLDSRGLARGAAAFESNEPDHWRATRLASLTHENGPDHYMDLEELTPRGMALAHASAFAARVRHGIGTVGARARRAAQAPTSAAAVTNISGARRATSPPITDPTAPVPGAQPRRVTRTVVDEVGMVQRTRLWSITPSSPRRSARSASSTRQATPARASQQAAARKRGHGDGSALALRRRRQLGRAAHDDPPPRLGSGRIRTPTRRSPGSTDGSSARSLSTTGSTRRRSPGSP